MTEALSTLTKKKNIKHLTPTEVRKIYSLAVTILDVFEDTMEDQMQYKSEFVKGLKSALDEKKRKKINSIKELI